ncbi:hypothetical protein [Halorussus halophilus]|uniref:hypothetical protein n=1 Tax=Halorussus halophilus TaxID=2650975 RepID=UPI001300D267|nr:hypothetical protein [Halorussus halophilus]
MKQSDETGTETDSVFGFIAGVYAAAVLAPAVTILAAVGVSENPATLFFSFLGSVIVFAGFVGWQARQESVAVRLGRTKWIWLAVVAPFGYGVLMFVVIAAGLRGAAVGVSMAGMIAGMITGMGFAVAAQNRYARATLSGSEEYVRFTASAPKRDRRLVMWSIAVFVVVGLAGMVASVVADFELGEDLYLLLPISGGLLGATTTKTFAVTDAGFLTDQRVHKNLQSWDDFEGFSVREDAVILRRAGWSAFGLRDIRRDAADIEDVDELAEALERFLPRE